MNRIFLLSLVVFLCGCTSDMVRHCDAMSGAWTPMKRAPDNAADLLAMEGIPNDLETRWYGHGPDHLLACIYAGSLTNPSCGAATVYEYEELDGRWYFRHTAMEACKPQFE